MLAAEQPGGMRGGNTNTHSKLKKPHVLQLGIKTMNVDSLEKTQQVAGIQEW